MKRKDFIKKSLIIGSGMAAFNSCKKENEFNPISIDDIIKKRLLPPPQDQTLQRGNDPAPSGNFTLARYDGNVSGVQSTFDVRNVGNESGRSVWCSITVGGIWVQIGYEKRGVHVLQYYYGVMDEMTIINPTAPMYIGSKNVFFIRNVTGTTYWEIGRNGVVLIKWNAHTTEGYGSMTGIEYYGSNTKFPKINFYPALEIMDSTGTWKDAPTARVAYRGRYGIEGKNQNPSLRLNELNMAGDVPTVFPDWYFLW